MRLYVTFSACVYLFSSLSFATSFGAWYKNPEQAALSEIFSPAFHLLKIGIFSKMGVLKILHPKKKIQALCQTGTAWEGWITHRLSPGETLSKEAGETLGAALNTFSQGTCLKRMEIDLEPLKEATPWLLEFLKGVKSQAPHLEIRLAVPALSDTPLSGFTWTKKSLESVLEVSDGADLMLYDTGLGDPKAYTRLVTEAIRFALSQTPRKSIVLGLPAYNDKTKYHHRPAENLSSALKALQTFSPEELRAVCLKKIRFAYYAGWTLVEKDRENAKNMEQWYVKTCQASDE